MVIMICLTSFHRTTVNGEQEIEVKLFLSSCRKIRMAMTKSYDTIKLLRLQKREVPVIILFIQEH